MSPLRLSPSQWCNTPKLSFAQRKKQRARVYAVLLEPVGSALSPGVSVYSSVPQSIIAWKKGDWVYCFQLNAYDEFAWRFTNRWIHQHRLPSKLRTQIKPDLNLPGAFYGCRVPEPKHQFELSFIGQETPLVATPALVRFVESAFTTEESSEVYRWDLFAHDENYPGYAWTCTGGQVVSRQQRTRTEQEEGMNRSERD